MEEKMGKVTLKSCDDMIFEVEEIVALESRTIKIVTEDGFGNSALPLPLVKGKTLEKIIEYCKRHTDVENSSEEELKKFDDEFLDRNQKMLYDLMSAANYLQIDSLFNLIRPKIDPVEIRTMCSIVDDFHLEDIENIRSENL